MNKFDLNPEVESQINLKEAMFVLNTISNNYDLKGFDSLRILTMSTNDDPTNKLMTEQVFTLNVFFAPNLNKKTTVKISRAKNWSCSQTQVKITETIEL